MAGTPPKLQEAPAMRYDPSDPAGKFIGSWPSFAFAIVGQTSSGQPIAAFGVTGENTTLAVIDVVDNLGVDKREVPYLSNIQNFPKIGLTAEGDHLNPTDVNKVREMLDKYMPKRKKDWDFKNNPLKRSSGSTFPIVTLEGAPATQVPAPGNNTGISPDELMAKIKPGMPVAEIRKVLSQAMQQQLDSDKNAYISVQELQPLLNEPTFAPILPAVKKIFELKENASNAQIADAINKELHPNAPVPSKPSTTTSAQPSAQPPKSTSKMSPQELRRYTAQQTDADGDGVVKLEEFNKLFGDASADALKAIRKLFTFNGKPLAADASNEQMAAAINQEWQRAGIRHSIAKMTLQEADTNKDGKINETEGRNISEKEFSNFFKDTPDGRKAIDIIRRSFGMVSDATNAEMAGAINNELQLPAPLKTQNKNGKAGAAPSRK